MTLFHERLFVLFDTPFHGPFPAIHSNNSVFRLRPPDESRVPHDRPIGVTRVTRVRSRMDLSSRPRGQHSWTGLLSEYCFRAPSLRLVQPTRNSRNSLECFNRNSLDRTRFSTSSSIVNQGKREFEYTIYQQSNDRVV